MAKNLEKGIEEALSLTFSDLEKGLDKFNTEESGSTACIVHIIKDPSNSKYPFTIYSANVGDTRCSLISPELIKRLTFDHRVTDINEKMRMLQSGAHIKDPMVKGEIMLSRAFGDENWHSIGVKCDPYIQKTLISSKTKYQYLIIASDGIWDKVSEEDIQNIIPNCLDSNNLNKSIIKMAITRGASDNLSLFVIRLL